MPKHNPEHERQRKFRAKHKPDVPPYIGIYLRHGDAACLAAGLITDSLKQLAVDALAEFWPAEENKESVR